MELEPMEMYLRRAALEKELPPDSWLRDLPVIGHLAREGLDFTRPVTVFVGENGIGKSTLIEALAIGMGFNAEGGSRNFNFLTAEAHSDLHDYLRLIKGVRHMRDGYFLRAESFFNAETYLREHNDDGKAFSAYGCGDLHELSHGQAFLALAKYRFGGNGLYILDEPEAALSPMKQLDLLAAIDRLVGCRSQFILSTHSPILMAYPGADVVEITETGLHHVPYNETEHFTMLKRFLNAPDKVLQWLLGPDEPPRD